MKKIFYLGWFFLAFGCSYKMDTSDGLVQKRVNVPFVIGDSDGRLTAALTYQLSSQGLLEYSHSKADFILRAEVISLTNDKIGYKKDRDPDGKLRKNLMPIEGREKIEVRVTLLSNLNKEVVWGPKLFSTDIDYDYVDEDSVKDLSFINDSGQRETVLSFSLGQLESVFCAQEAALRPLYIKIAKNIVSVLSSELKDSGYSF